MCEASDVLAMSRCTRGPEWACLQVGHRGALFAEAGHIFLARRAENFGDELDLLRLRAAGEQRSRQQQLRPERVNVHTSRWYLCTGTMESSKQSCNLASAAKSACILATTALMLSVCCNRGSEASYEKAGYSGRGYACGL